MYNLAVAVALDNIMERASRALAETAYLTCESLCLQALAAARNARRWADYARILLPLQEARRQRRQIAADGTVRLGTATLAGPPTAWLDQLDIGCIMLTPPHQAADARALCDAARAQERYLEVLLADHTSDSAPGSTWRLHSFAGPEVTCEVTGPPPAWCERWWTHAQVAQVKAALSPADWFLDAAEALGDAALAAVTAPLDSPQGLLQLEACLAVVSDHERLHQHLGNAARALARSRNAEKQQSKKIENE